MYYGSKYANLVVYAPFVKPFNHLPLGGGADYTKKHLHADIYMHISITKYYNL